MKINELTTIVYGLSDIKIVDGSQCLIYKGLIGNVPENLLYKEVNVIYASTFEVDYEEYPALEIEIEC